jgi:hypothetical protein
MWQDYTIAVSQIVLALSLLPTLFSKKEKPPIMTALPTSISLFLMSYAMLFLRAYFSSALLFVNSVLWFIITYQRYLLNKIISKD